MLDDLNEHPFYIDLSQRSTVIEPYRIKKGSKIQLGDNIKFDIRVDQHFNWFQKLMWKWCFGFKVEDYSEV